MRREWVSTGGSFSDEQRRGLVKAGAHTARQAKDDKNDFASWSLQADEAGYRYATVLHQVQSDQQPLSDQPVDQFSKHCLVKGVDELGYILEQGPEIAAYEASHPAPINALA